MSAPSQLLLRILVAAASTAVLVLVARDRETFYQLAAGRLVFTQVKSSYIPGLVFLACSSGILAIYSLLLLISSAASSCRSPPAVALLSRSCTGSWILLLIDQSLAYLIMASASSATDVLYLTDHGNPKAGWDDKCSTYGRFCTTLKASIVLSFAAVLLQACVSVTSAKLVFKHYVKIIPHRDGGSGDSKGHVVAARRALPEAI